MTNTLQGMILISHLLCVNNCDIVIVKFVHCHFLFPPEAFFLNFDGFSSLCNIRYEGALDPWLLSLWKSLNEINPSLLPRVSDINDSNLSILGDPKVHVIYYSSNEVPQDSVLSGMNE
jgi:hypothetical protein